MSEINEEPTEVERQYAEPKLELGSWRVVSEHRMVSVTESRQPFVTGSVYRFTQSIRVGMEEAVFFELVDLILTKVIEDDDQWESHKDEDWFNPAAVEAILAGCLMQVDRAKPLNELAVGEVKSVALPIFSSILKGRWHCPVPFILC